MRSLVTSVLLGVGVIGASAALPQQAKAMGPWHGHYYGHVRYVGPRYFGPVVGPIVTPAFVAPTVVGPTVVAPTVVGPTVVAPAIAPYASFSFGRWGGPVWRGYYHRR
jgi:hypothetical protein